MVKALGCGRGSLGLVAAGLLAALVAGGGLGGCGDDVEGPHIKTELERLEGAWHALSLEIDGVPTPLPDGNVYWYFDGQGRYCVKYRTAYGEYYPAFWGRVSTDLVLASGLPDSTLNTWQLSLSAGEHTRVADLLASTVTAADKWTLVRASDRTDDDCFCD